MSGNAGTHAFLFSNGTMTNQGAPGGTSSGSRAINVSGQVTGELQISSTVEHSFLYSNGSMLDLNNLITPGSGITLSIAYGINDAGDIYGMASQKSGRYAFELTPAAVPEPAGIAALSLVGLAMLGHRRRPRMQWVK
jgi:probable HAF family extracellular repeat protein